MRLLNRIKSLVGLGSDRADASDPDVEVTVENSSSDRRADERSESVEEAEQDPEDWGVPPGYDGDESNVQAGPEAFADVQEAETNESVNDASGAGESDTPGPASETEPGGVSEAEAEAAQTDQSGESDDERDWNAIDDSSSEEAEGGPIEEAEGDRAAASDGPPLADVKGIGPAYEQRLNDAGVHSIAELIDAETATLAERTDLSDTRIGRWQERAEELSGN